jgi:lipid II:glycine glycyltransferase (peptidoglycan interpeptide bridge formation enzyme)
VAEESLHFLQAPFYGHWQQASGKKVIYYLVFKASKIIGGGLAVRYTLPFRNIGFFYSPYGPVMTVQSAEAYKALHNFFKAACKHHNCAFARFDNTLPTNKRIPNALAATANLQPRAEWLLDISQSNETLLASMHKHARYNIRLAERAKARFAVFSPEDAPFEQFYGLMHVTGERDKFSIFSQEYYQAVFNSLSSKEAFVAICYIYDKPAAAGLFVTFDGVVHYVFAGSSNDYRKIAPAYFLIWQAVLTAKQRNCRVLNFGGITDNVKNKHLHGVTGFKKRFGGYEVTRDNPYDVVANRFVYTLFGLYKRLFS